MDVAIPTIAVEFGCSVELALWAKLGPEFFQAQVLPALTVGRRVTQPLLITHKKYLRSGV
jgi:hypothetical protein